MPDNNKDNKETSASEKLAPSQIAKAAIRTLHKPVTDEMAKYKSPTSTSEQNNRQQGAGASYDLLSNFLSLTATQPLIAAATRIRNRLPQDTSTPLGQISKEELRKLGKDPLQYSYGKPQGAGVFQRRLVTFVGVNGAIDQALPPIYNKDDLASTYADTFKRSMAKAGAETMLNIYSEASTLKDFYFSDKNTPKDLVPTTPKVMGKIAAPSFARNLALMAPYESAKTLSKTNSYSPTEAAVAGGVAGLAAGFAAGIIDGQFTFKQVAELANQASANTEKTASRALAGGVTRAVHAAINTGGLVGGLAFTQSIVKKAHEVMHQADEHGKTIRFTEKDLESLKESASKLTERLKGKAQDVVDTVHIERHHTPHYRVKRTGTKAGNEVENKKKSFSVDYNKPPALNHSDRYIKSKIEEYQKGSSLSK